MTAGLAIGCRGFASGTVLPYLSHMTTGQLITRETLRAAFAGSPRRSLPLHGYQHAAVLVPVIPGASGVELLFTQRTENVETHKGQVSFPGGVVEPDDRDIIHTALREAYEEVDIAVSNVEVIGLLDDLATPTGFVITPVVGLVSPDTVFRPNAGEVAEVFRVPLEFFVDPSHGRSETRMVRGTPRELWHYDSGSHAIWGATAAIVRSLLSILRLL